MINVYLRASTDKQDATRAKKEVLDFVSSKNTNNYAVQLFIENASGSSLERPVLNDMLETAQEGSILVVEKMDRLTRLEWSQWQELHAKLKAKKISIVCVDQVMTHDAFAPSEAQSAIMQALSNFILDLAASMARDDYETRKKRQAQGIAKAKAAGVYKGRAVDTALHDRIKTLLSTGMSKSKIATTLQCSRTTVYKVASE